MRSTQGILVLAGVGEPEAVPAQEIPPRGVKLHDAPAAEVPGPETRTNEIGSLATKVARATNKPHSLVGICRLAGNVQSTGKPQTFMICEDTYVFIARRQTDDCSKAGTKAPC